jgi:hypothetical protein
MLSCSSASGFEHNDQMSEGTADHWRLAMEREISHRGCASFSSIVLRALFGLNSLDPPTRDHQHAMGLQISETGTLRQGLSVNLTLVPSSVKDGRVVYSDALP